MSVMSVMSRYFTAAKHRQLKRRLKEDADRRARLMSELDDVFMTSELRALITVHQATDRLRKRLAEEGPTYTREDLLLEESRK